MINEVITGVLVDAIAVAGRRLASSAKALAGRRRSDDLAITRWFDTYRLTEDPPEFPQMAPAMLGRLAALLQGNDMQAVLHELLAARLTDAPEADVERIRAVFDFTLVEESPELAELGGELFGFYDEQISELVGRLEGSAPPLLAQIRAEALSSRMVAILGRIEQHAAALSATPGRQAVAGFLARYRRHVIEHHGLIEPPDFNRRQRVPIADLYVRPVIVQLVDGEPPPNSGAAGLASPREVDLWTLAGEIDRTVLLGDPGGGKTTATTVLMHYYASDTDRRVPFLVTLREFAAASPPERSVAEHIEHRLDTFYQCPAPRGVVARLLLSGAAMVIFDGLDELLDPAWRLEVTAIVERFSTEYPLVPVLVTSRLVGYDQARLDDRQFARYRISRFDDDQVAGYVRNWFALEEGRGEAEANRSAVAFMNESASIPDLRSNPLMLALMCILYRGQGSLPRDRAGIYEQCSTMLFHRWDARRKIYSSLRAGHLIEPTLQHLAWWLFTQDQSQATVTEPELIKETAGFLNARGFESIEEARQAAEEFVGFCRGRMWVFSDSGTTASGEVMYSFTHRTFLEYFAAAHLAFESDTPERLARALAPRVARHEWEVVGELAVQIKDRVSSRGAERIYAVLLDERRRRSPAGRGGVLQFLARCLRSVNPPPHTTRALTRQILDHLFGGNPDQPIRHLPLCSLLTCCDQQRYVISDEIGSRITGMVQAFDSDVQLKGLRLAVFLPFGEQQTSLGPGLPGGSELANFWWDRTAEHLQDHAQIVTAAASDDFGIRLGAIWWHIIKLSQALQMPGGPTPLFAYPAGNFGANWTSFLPQMAETAISAGGSLSTSSWTIENLAAFGHYLATSKFPPWIDELTDDLSEYLPNEVLEPSDTDSGTDPLTDPFAYLGAAAILCIIVESVESNAPPIKDLQYNLGALGGIYPYIARRANSESILQCEELPVPTPFKAIFNDWANHKLNLASRGCSARQKNAGILGPDRTEQGP